MCTIVTMAKGGVVLAGNNEDYIEPRTKIWFFPATQAAYGRVIVGYDRSIDPCQGGMNDQGLFIDLNAVKPTGWQRDPGKPDFEGDIIEHILSHCATVNEVVDFFRRHNTPDLGVVRAPVADAAGDSVIVEWAKGQAQFLHKQGDYQISTNFIQSDYDDPEDYPCHRYKIADQILGNAEAASVDLIRSVLSATHFEYFAQTLYSNICDLKEKRIYLYHFHNFEEAVVFDLPDELEKGGTAYSIPSLFATKPFAAHLFERIGPQAGARDLLAVIDAQGIQEGIARFHEMVQESQTFRRYAFEEWVLRDLAYTLLASDRGDDALEILKLNAQLYPESWQVHADLAEAYTKRGDTAQAIAHDRQALALNRDHGNAPAGN